MFVLWEWLRGDRVGNEMDASCAFVHRRVANLSSLVLRIEISTRSDTSGRGVETELQVTLWVLMSTLQAPS